MKLPLCLLSLVCTAVLFPGGRAGGEEKDVLGMQKIELPGRTLRIELQSELRCTFGDADLMRLDMAAARGEGDFQVTVEALHGPKEQVYYATGDIRSGSYTVKLPEFSTATVLGVFLCGTPKNGAKTPCSKKKLHSYEEMFAPHQLDTRQPSRKGALPIAKPDPSAITDRLYFFRFVLAEGRRLEVPTKPMTVAGYERLLARLRAGKIDAGQLSALGEKLKAFGSTLQSEPLEAGKGVIRITLPRFDRQKCVLAAGGE